jgi:hypothetical protein
MSTGIIGCGAAGSLCLLELVRKGNNPESLIVIDPYFDGGDLGRRWGEVKSNTKWRQITECISIYTSTAQPIAELSKKYQPEDICALSDLAYLLQESVKPILQAAVTHATTCQKIQKNSRGWSLHLANGSTEEITTLFLCQGAIEKSIDFGKPIIPLEIALDSSRLARYVRPGQIISVFGIAHSGTLIMKNLTALGATVNGFYNSEKPFYFAREGAYEGVKEEAAAIADDILSKKLPVKLYSSNDTKNLVKVLTKTDWVILSIGFTLRTIQILAPDGTQLNEVDYSPTTALVAGQPGLYGFGISYPGVSEIEGKTYKDVSIPSFVQQIQRCLAEI